MKAPRLTEQIKGLRRSIAAEMGFVLPPVRIQDNMQLGADGYAIRIKEIEAGSGELRPGHAAGDGPQGRHYRTCRASATTEPAFGLPAHVDRRHRCRRKRCSAAAPWSIPPAC